MKKLFFTFIGVGSFLATMSQSLISEKQIPLTKDQTKYEMDFALINSTVGGATVFFEPQKADKVKGEKRKWERYEMIIDKDMNVSGGEYKTLGTKNSIKPRIYFDNFRIAYTTWVDDEYLDTVWGKKGDYKIKEVPKIVFQLVKYDNNNKITDIEDYVLCDEKGFDSYRVIQYKGELLVMAQYEKKKTKNPDEKNRDFLVYNRIDPATMKVKANAELNLLGKDELGFEAFVAANDKIFLVGKQLLQTKVLGIKMAKSYFIFRLGLDGTEEARGTITIPFADKGIGSVYLYENNDTIYMAGEYGDPKSMGGRAPSMKAGSVKCLNPFEGMFIKKFDFDLKEVATATFDYKEKIMKKLKKGNPKFNPRKGNFNLQDFYVLPDGSFYITAEMFVKIYKTTETKSGDYVTYRYYTEFYYMDAVVFKFNAKGELEWLDQIDRDDYKRTYSGHLKTQKPLEPGKLEVFLMKDSKLACFYNTPGRKYGKKRFGLSEVVVSSNGDMSQVYDYTSEAQFGLLDGGLIKIDDNTIMAIGTDKKEKNCWVKKIKIVD
ncbi:MAG: hypothetical protein HGB12_00700 [Bacteroidetes bacterium]|nr:hypothetical protein [Bacteroidota bacterium]